MLPASLSIELRDLAPALKSLHFRFLDASRALSSSRSRLSAHIVSLTSAWLLNVEVDEAYIGGRPKRGSGVRGRSANKTPIVALVEREGTVKTRVVCNVNAFNLYSAILFNVDKSATIHTDEFRAYSGIGEHFAGGHKRVNHSRGQYVGKDGGSTNLAESYFALIKRGMYGNFQHVSKKHLQRYCHEFEFRWNSRKLRDGERVVLALSQTEGKRLTYRQPTS